MPTFRTRASAISTVSPRTWKKTLRTWLAAGGLYLDRIAGLSAEIGELDGRIAAAAKESDVARKLRTMLGIGPVYAMAIGTFAPDMSDVSSRLGLVPRQHSSGGKQKLGRTSRMGQRDLRRLLIVGAMSVVRWRGR